MILVTITEFPLEFENIPLEFEILRYMTEDDCPVLVRRIAEECNGHLVFLVLMIGCFKEGKECADECANLMAGIFSMAKEYNGHNRLFQGG